jgi:hypothetical protein
MESITELFAPALKTIFFFKEWARFIRTKASADSLAIIVLEGMRNADDSIMRIAWTHFATFMKSRNWSEGRAELEEHFEQADRQVLNDPYATELYDRLKAIVTGQIEEYYEQFIIEQNKKRKDLKTFIENDPLQKIEIRMSQMMDARLAASMEILKETIVGELKKRMGEGENWKT